MLHCMQRGEGFTFSQTKRIRRNLTAEAPSPIFHCSPPVRLWQFWQDLAEVPKPGKVTLLASNGRGARRYLSPGWQTDPPRLHGAGPTACFQALDGRWETWGMKQTGMRVSNRGERWGEYGHFVIRCGAVEAEGLQDFGNWDRTGQTAPKVLKVGL